MMEFLSDNWTAIAGMLGTAIGFIGFYGVRKRKMEAEALAIEVDAKSKVAEEWKRLYEQRDKRVGELNAKIDQLYKEKEDDRQRIRGLQEKNASLSLENQSLRIKECQVRGCKDRRPPSDY